MEKKIAQLQEKIEWYQHELEELHVYEPSEDWYRLRRSEIEFKIACLEQTIDELKREEYINPRRPSVLALILLVGIAILFSYMITKL